MEINSASWLESNSGEGRCVFNFGNSLGEYVIAHNVTRVGVLGVIVVTVIILMNLACTADQHKP